MTRDRSIQITALITLIVALVASVFLGTRIVASSGQHQLVYTDTAEEATTPEEALGIAAGAFRGMFVNWLWMRAQDLKQDGKYHESIELARTITRLQPRFPRVWAFHAWNLAYNISVAAQNPMERWQWVNAGIRLLRDEGIPKNPNDLLLHKELAWIFLHKIQNIMDDSNQTYKRELAKEWTIALGAPPVRTPDLRSADRYAEVLIRWLRNVAEAPKTIDEMIATETQRYADEYKRDLPAVMPELLARIKAEANLDLANIDDLLRFRRTFEVLRSLTLREQARAEAMKSMGLPAESQQAREARAMALGASIGPEARNDALINILTEAKYDAALVLLNRHARRRIIEDRYHMEPERMVRYTQKYGPIDWRLPQTHALYWSARGVEEALDKRNEHTVENLDFLNTDRITIQAVQELFRYGTLLYDIVTPNLYIVLPNVDFIDTYGNILAELTERERQQFLAQRDTDVADRVWTLYRAGYENFLHDAISFLYRRGELDRAKQYQTVLATWPGRVANDIEQQKIRELPLDDFVVWNIKDRITSPNVAVAEIVASLHAAYADGLLAGDQQRFRSAFEYAKRFHKEYMTEQYRKVPAAEVARMAMIDPDFRVAASQVLASMLMIIPPQDASLMYLRAPNDLRVSTWDILDEVIGAQGGEAPGQDSPISTFFPRPPGVDEYRAAKPKRAGTDVKKGEAEMK